MMSTEELSDLFEADSRDCRREQLRWALRVRDQIEGLSEELQLHWGMLIAKAHYGEIGYHDDYYELRHISSGLETYDMPACLLPVFKRVFHKTYYAHWVHVDPVRIKFSVEQTPLLVKRIAAGSKDAMFELCEKSIEGCRSYAMLDERLPECESACLVQGLDVEMIRQLATERYRQIEREEF